MIINPNLYPAKKNGRSGYIDRTGKIIIDFEFDFFGSRDFSEGLASVMVRDKAGFIDESGNFIIEPKYEMALGFSEGLALVKYKGKYSYIDRNGNFIIQPNFYRCDSFKDGLAWVMDVVKLKSNFIDKAGKIKFSERYYLNSKYNEGLINCDEEGGWGFIDSSDRFIIPPIYKYARPFFENKAAVLLKNTSTRKATKKALYGFINKNNDIIIDPKFQGANIRFSEGLCAVGNNTYGYINQDGEIVIPYEFALGGHFNEGMAVIKPKGRNKKYGCIDTEGNITIEPIFTHIEDFQNGLSEVIIGDNYDNFRYGYINKQGEYIWEPTR